MERVSGGDGRAGWGPIFKSLEEEWKLAAAVTRVSAYVLGQHCAVFRVSGEEGAAAV
jgi:hypothetical protein